MTIRLHEVHPSLVHMPITLVPVAIGADIMGRATGNRGLLEMGRRSMDLAAAGAALSTISGLIAQEEVNADGEAKDMLITHRNINLAATVMTGLMALWRTERYRPSLAYLGLGVAGVAALTYSAYLGGTMVYQHGVGVAPAGGQWRENEPALGKGRPARVIKDVATDIARGMKHLVQELAKGKIVPWLTDGHGQQHAEGAERTGNAMSSEEQHASAT